MFRKLVACALWAAAWTCAAAPLQLTEQEQAGQRIFMRGESPSGAQINARMGQGLELTGASVACGNCHGEDGRGRAEGGVEPQNIQWSELTKPYGHRHPNRSHGPFDEQQLRRAVLDGIDPDGNRLDAAMPRFSMSAKDLAALTAYIKKLQSILDPGLSADAIRIGTLLPLSGRMAALGESLRTLWTSYFASVNERGGIHGRRLELVVEPSPAAAGEAKARARALLEKDDVFAVLAPVSAGMESELADAATAANIPVIGPLTLFPEDTRASNRYVFHLLPGIAELAQVLTLFTAQELRLHDRPIALWHPDTFGGRAMAEALRTTLQNAGWRAPVPVAFPARGASQAVLSAHAAALKWREFAAVVVLGAGADIRAFADAAASIVWTPYLLVPGPLASRDIVELPTAFRDRVFLAYPTAPGDPRSAAFDEYTALTRTGGDSRANQPLQIAAYTAGVLLVEGLKRTGRDLTRRKLIDTLETVQSFDTGLIPPLSYNADRRIGAMGGYVLAVDLDQKTLRPLRGYVSLP